MRIKSGIAAHQLRLAHRDGLASSRYDTGFDMRSPLAGDYSFGKLFDPVLVGFNGGPEDDLRAYATDAATRYPLDGPSDPAADYSGTPGNDTYTGGADSDVISGGGAMMSSPARAAVMRSTATMATTPYMPASSRLPGNCRAIRTLQRRSSTLATRSIRCGAAQATTPSMPDLGILSMVAPMAPRSCSACGGRRQASP
jgi:hypothetical protein